jgi:hypothetical protein
MKRILLLLGLALAALAVYVSTLPTQFRVERSAIIEAPPAVVFRNLDDFRRWGPWSPWEELDPDMEREYAGPPSGAGATYHWRGDRDVGEGRMTIVDSDPPTRITLRLELMAPMQGTNDVVFDVSPHLAGTSEVHWMMSGERDFVRKAIALVMNMDAQIGADYEKGLAELKRVSEEQARAEQAAAAAAAQAAAAEAEQEAAPAAAATAPAEPAAP